MQAVRVEEQNVAILTEAYRTWHETKGASVEDWMELMAEEVRFHSLAEGAPGMEWTGTCCSKDDVRGYFEGLVADWEMIHYTVEEFIAQDDRVVMLGRSDATVKEPMAPADKITSPPGLSS